MKQKAKNALKHDVEILGRSVSVLLLAGLIMAAGASAALLDSFGTIDGQADVQQAVLVNDGEHQQDNSFGFPSEAFPAGTVATDVVTLENKGDVAASVDPETSYEYATNDTGVSKGISTEYLPVETVEEVTGDGDHGATAEIRIADDSSDFDKGTVLVDATTETGNMNGDDKVEAGFTVETDHKVGEDQEELTFTVDYEAGDDRGGEDTKNAPDHVVLETDHESVVADVTADGEEVTLSVDGNGDHYVSEDLRGETITSVTVSTGTAGDAGSGDTSDITYNVDSVVEDFDGTSSLDSLEVEPGTEALGIKNEFDVALVPENYYIETEFLTHEG